MNQASKVKYRPVLTAAHIEKILELAKTEQPTISDISISLIGVLAPFKAKIDNDGIQPAYIVEPRASIMDKLGAIDPKYGTKENHWEACYIRVQEYGADQCTLEEIKASNEHKYLNGLMSDEEAAHFETNILPS